MKTIGLFLLLLTAGLLHATEPPSPTLPPGTVLTLNFPELGQMHRQLPAACEVSIPRDYDPAKPVPLLVWISGGSGSHAVARAEGLVDFDRFLVVALPFPNGTDPRNVANHGNPDDHWTFQRAILERVHTLFPNIDPAMRLVAGTSNGGHLIGFGLDRAWPGFSDHFTAFIIHEGGIQPITANIPNAKGKRVLVAYGEKSPSIVWTGWFCWNLQRSGADATFIALPDSTHGLGADGRRTIRQWIDALNTR